MFHFKSFEAANKNINTVNVDAIKTEGTRVRRNDV